MPGGIQPPLEVLLSWPRPNLINPELKPNTITVLAYVLGPLTVILFLARLWVRILHQRNPGWDDWVMLAAMVPTMGSTVIGSLAGEKYFNRHVWDFDTLNNPELLVTSRKYVLAMLCNFCVASGLIKISILLFYRRLSSRVVSRTFRWVTWTAIGSIVGYTFALTIAPIVGCRPIAAYWDQVSITKKLQGYEFHCFDEGADIFAAGVLSAVQDLVTAVLPTFLYWNLRIPLRQKIALFGIFAMGYGCVAIGGLRIYYGWRTFYATYDVTWSTWDLVLTSMIELHVGCFCANAPALKVFFQYFYNEKLTSHGSSKTPKDSKERQISETSRSTASKGKSIFGKMASLLSSTHSHSGYISEPHHSVAVEAHGSVQVRDQMRVLHSPSSISPLKNQRNSANTTDLIYDQFYDEDIELGRFTTANNSLDASAAFTRVTYENVISALPPMPKSPESNAPLRAQSTLESIKLVFRQHSDKDARRTSMPGAMHEQKAQSGRTGTPIPARRLSDGGKRPDWQSWT